MLDDMALSCHCSIRAAVAAVTNRATENENISSICIAGVRGRKEGASGPLPCLSGILASRRTQTSVQVKLAALGIGFGHRRR